MDKKRAVLILWFVFVLCSVAFMSVRWLATYYSGISIQEILFHIAMPLEGTSKDLIDSFLREVLAPVGTLSLALLVFGLFGARRSVDIDFSFPSSTVSLRLRGAIMVNSFFIVFSIFSIGFASAELIESFGVINYIRYATASTDLYTNEYIDPANVAFKFPATKRNLVLVFLESVESSFFLQEDGGNYSDDLMPEFAALAKANVHFSDSDVLGGANQVGGTGWTIAALVAHTMGIPLVLPFYGNAYQGYDEFLPGAKGLTDILGAAGYEQRFLIGSDKKFAGRDTLFETHGNVLVKDTTYYKNAGLVPPDYSVWWGFEDQKLYSLAKRELTELAAGDKPFNVMLLTVDTHHVGGYVCELCDDEFDEQYKNVLACASRQAQDFVSWIQRQAWFENTAIVLVGDHFYMDGSFLPVGAKRRTYNVYINPFSHPVRSVYRDFSTLDTLPSILDSLGVSYDAPGLGLGRSLFKDTQTLLEQYGKASIDQELSKKNKEYDRFLYGE